MKSPRTELDARLDTLAANVAQMFEGSSEPLRDAIDRAGNEILRDAHPNDMGHVWSRLQCIQRDAGLIPGDEQPCNDGEAKADDDAVSQ
jgi:hypothetical protein